MLVDSWESDVGRIRRWDKLEKKGFEEDKARSRGNSDTRRVRR